MLGAGFLPVNPVGDYLEYHDRIRQIEPEMDQEISTI